MVVKGKGKGKTQSINQAIALPHASSDAVEISTFPNPFWRTELDYLGRGLGAWQLYALLVLAALLITLAYQAPLEWKFKLGLANPADHLYTQSFNQPEANPELSFRWSSDESRIRFPGVGRIPYARLEITMQIGGRPAELGNAKVQIWHEQELLGAVEVEAGAKVYRFEYRAKSLQSASDLDGNLIFTLKSPTFEDKNHNLPLGVVVSEIRLVGGSEAGRSVLPAIAHFALLITGLIVLFLAMVRAGWGVYGAFGIAGLVALGAGAAIAFARLHLTPGIEPLFMMTLLAYPLMIIGLYVTQKWLKGDLTVKSARWLGLIFLAVFVIKAAGMSHPAFTVLDHWFRVHQLLRLWDNSTEFWAQYFNVSAGASVTGAESGSAVLGQWGLKFSLPYSPLFYLFASPLALIWRTSDPNLLIAVNNLATWLEASQIFLIYIIARQAYGGRWANRAGLIAAAFLGFYPLSYLLFSDGGYNSIFAQWLTLLFVALLVTAVRHKARWSAWRWGGLILTLAFALLAHTATLIMVGLLVAVTCGLWFTQAGWRWAAKRLALVGLASAGLSLLLYYGYYLINFLTESLPLLLSKLGQGGVGQDNDKLGTKLLSGFFPQLWEHFRLFPFLLAIIALLLLKFTDLERLEARSNHSNGVPDKAATNDTTLDKDHRNATWLLWVAWMSVFLVFAAADLRVNLLQKHMLFAAPLLCLGSGFALSLIGERVSSVALSPTTRRVVNWAMTGVIALLIAFMIWQGLVVWYGRVYAYILPPGSG